VAQLLRRAVQFYCTGGHRKLSHREAQLHRGGGGEKSVEGGGDVSHMHSLGLRGGSEYFFAERRRMTKRG